ncbi:hypothetical protein KA107_02515 [Candidatus Pacearchaeota archaeon]|nr:hypothetical protein [Candidatus Pacearchaeota archaeon]
MNNSQKMFFLGRWQARSGANSIFVMEINGAIGERYDRYGKSNVRDFILLPEGDLAFKVKYDPNLSREGADNEITFRGRRISENDYFGEYSGEPGIDGSFELEQIEYPGVVLRDLLHQKMTRPLERICF